MEKAFKRRNATPSLSPEYLSLRLNRITLFPQKEANKKLTLTDENKQKLTTFKGAHKGERCIIVGGSPSLKQLDISKLNGENVITVNRGYEIRNNGLRSVLYHLIGDTSLFYEDDITDELHTEWANFFFFFGAIAKKMPFQNVAYFDYAINVHDFFQTDIVLPLNFSYTIIFNAIEIACYMGFKEIILIGVDLNFAENPGHAYLETQGEKQRQVKFSIPHTAKMLHDIQYAMSFLEKRGVSVKNASPVESLPFMPKIAYGSLFE